MLRDKVVNDSAKFCLVPPSYDNQLVVVRILSKRRQINLGSICSNRFGKNQPRKWNCKNQYRNHKPFRKKTESQSNHNNKPEHRCRRAEKLTPARTSDQSSTVAAFRRMEIIQAKQISQT